MRSSSATGSEAKYELLEQIASGGMGSVHLGRLRGAAGFSKIVAIKRLHSHLAFDDATLLDEARLAARIRHANVVPTLDVVTQDGQMLLVMEYVLGGSLAELLQSGHAGLPPDLACTIAIHVLEGLHAAHESKDDAGVALATVHRDVSPQNVLVGVDGTARVVDFGIAHARGRLQVTREGEVKGKAAYMAPEQMLGEPVDRRTDVYGVGVILWEALTGRRLFVADHPLALVKRILEFVPPPPSRFAAVSPAIDAIVARALAKDPCARFPTARAMAEALDRASTTVSARSVRMFVEERLGGRLASRASSLEMAVRTATAASLPTAVTVPLLGSGRRRRRVASVVVVASTLIAGMLALSSSFRGRTEAHPLVAVPSVPPASVSAPLMVIAPLEAPPAASTPPPPPRPTAARRTPAVRTPPPRDAAPPSAPNCVPPYRIDPEGIRILKPECR